MLADAKDDILECLNATMRLDVPIPEEEVLVHSGYKSFDSTGYRAIMTELTKENQPVEKRAKKEWLTVEGIRIMAAKTDSLSSKPKTNAIVEVFYKDKIVKMGKGKFPDKFFLAAFLLL